MTLITTVLVGTVLGSYLALITNRNQEAMRSLAWNTAIPVLEAGIEEALTHMHDDANNPTANQWTAAVVDGQPAYWKTRTLPEGSYFYVTNVGPASPSPAIYSAGYVRSPLRDGQYISRLVRVTATNPPSVFSRAIAANGAVKLSGGAVVDGFNSAVGYYNATTNRNASGGIATDSGQVGAISVGSAHLYGTAVTGPGGTVSVSGGSVGDLNFKGPGIEGPEWTNNNMNVAFQSNALPVAQYLPIPDPTPINGSNITYLPSGNYEADRFISNDQTPMIVTGNATLWVRGNFIVASGYVYIQPGASLKLYVGGTASINGGGIVNGTQLPSALSYFGLSSNTNLNYNGTADFVGTINAPQANFVISGGASVYGAVICNTFTSSGGSSVHYDQALAGGGIFMVTSWREL